MIETLVQRFANEVAAGKICVPDPIAGEPYSRTVVHHDEACEVMIAKWRGAWCAPHDHGGRRGLVHVVRGRVEEASFGSVTESTVNSRMKTIRALGEGESLRCGGTDVHALRGDDGTITVHAYAGPDADFRVFSDDLDRVWKVPAAHGAWIPRDEKTAEQNTSSSIAKRVVWIGFTTKYRGGSREFARAAKTLADAKRSEFPDAEVRIVPLELKSQFVDAMKSLASENEIIEELHFIGHSGMYGVMFGSTKWPEQMSPHEWQALAIPFSKSARAYFHACRTARWFAGFFASIFGVETFGHHGYTTMSKSPERFTRLKKNSDPVFIVSCPGKKTHGLSGSIQKYVMHARTFPMTRFVRGESPERASYDAVAPLYAAAFEDIRLRKAEWKWLTGELSKNVSAPRVLDIGCGTGSMLRALAPRIGKSVGVDISRGMIDEANRSQNTEQLSFSVIDGPHLPFADNSFDIVTSFLSFRYLDWDPIIREIARVLTPEGRFLLVDMVEQPWDLRAAPLLLRGFLRTAKSRLSGGRQHRALREMVSKKEWKQMVATNPIRAEHEYRWYLESRFPGARLATLDVTRTKRTVAFASTPMSDARLTPLAFP
ncbi:MAG: methyltransferase domain-containing protein [Polyangiaceae bacterium]